MLRVLFTGLGSIGQRHARNLRTLLGDDVDLIAHRVRRAVPLLRSDMTPDPAGDVEEALAVRPFDSLEAALAERPDVVFVTNPAHLHVETARAALEAGAHLFVEKPLSDTWAGVHDLIDRAERAGRVAMVGYQLRFHPGYRFIRQLVQDGMLGRLLGARFSFGEHLPDWHPWEDYREGNAARADQGGGVLLAQIHDLDVVVGLFGQPRRVYAVGGQRSSLDVEVEDSVGVLLDCGGLPVQLHQDMVERPPRRTYEVIGEAGRVVWDYYANTVELVTPAGTELTTFGGLERNDLFLDELRHLLTCISTGETPVVDLRAGAASLAVALAAKESLRSRQAVEPR